MRKRLNKKASKRNFTRTARNVHPKNIRKNLSRGGYQI